jgi:hypothetical protein
MPQKTIDAKTLEYAAWICAGFDQFKRRGGYRQIQINRLTVIHAVQSWRDDLDRFGDYHYPGQPLPSEKLSPFKQVAYLMYWLVKTKPIFFQLGHSDPALLGGEFHDFDYAAVNEAFAFTHCINQIINECGIEPDNINRKLYRETYMNFRYDLYYRDVCPKQLFRTLELLAKTLYVRR